jgi:hypothetical protein
MPPLATSPDVYAASRSGATAGRRAREPYQRLLGGVVLGLPGRDQDGGFGGVLGDGHQHHHRGGKQLAAEGGLDGDVGLHARAAVLRDDGQHLEGQADALLAAVPAGGPCVVTPSAGVESRWSADRDVGSRGCVQVARRS